MSQKGGNIKSYTNIFGKLSVESKLPIESTLPVESNLSIKSELNIAFSTPIYVDCCNLISLVNLDYNGAYSNVEQVNSLINMIKHTSTKATNIVYDVSQLIHTDIESGEVYDHICVKHIVLDEYSTYLDNTRENMLLLKNFANVLNFLSVANIIFKK